MPIQQINYAKPRTLVSYSGLRSVRITLTRETRYQFSGVLLASTVPDETFEIGVERTDWNKSSFPLPWTSSPDVVTPTTPVPED
jgi:hypothetical protein